MRRLLVDQLQYIERDGTATLDYLPEETILIPDGKAGAAAVTPWGCVTPAAAAAAAATCSHSRQHLCCCCC